MMLNNQEIAEKAITEAKESAGSTTVNIEKRYGHIWKNINRPGKFYSIRSERSAKFSRFGESPLLL